MSYRTTASAETTAPVSTLWRLFADVEGWKTWNAGIEEITLHGPFAEGTRFTMKPPGQDALESTLVEVEENRGFTDVTKVGDLVVTVAHRLEPADAGRTRIVYSLEATGPDAEQIGAMIASDFTDVIASLIARAERG